MIFSPEKFLPTRVIVRGANNSVRQSLTIHTQYFPSRFFQSRSSSSSHAHHIFPHSVSQSVTHSPALSQSACVCLCVSLPLSVGYLTGSSTAELFFWKRHGEDDDDCWYSAAILGSQFIDKSWRKSSSKNVPLLVHKAPMCPLNIILLYHHRTVTVVPRILTFNQYYKLLLLLLLFLSAPF